MICLMLICMAGASLADGSYQADIDGKQITLTFTPGPFGPEESGRAALFIDGKQEGEYQYLGYDYGGTDVLIYDVQGLCWFVAGWNKIDAIQPLGISLTRQAEAGKSIYQKH